MNPSDVAREIIGKYMARMGTPGSDDHQAIMKGLITDALTQAISEEREACAMVAECGEVLGFPAFEPRNIWDKGVDDARFSIATAIRKRGEVGV